MIVVDTSAWIEFLTNDASSQSKAIKHLIESDAEIGITDIVLTEVLQGIKDDRDFHSVKELLMSFPIYQASGLDTFVAAANIYRECRRKGKTVRKTVDCIIAAICLENGFAIFHKDRDFDQIAACTNLKTLR
jgi:predicted nucleic acid-binding protein